MNYFARTEYHEQIAVIEYLRTTYPNILLTIAPNGLKLTIGQARKYKAMGYTAGTPDLLIFEPRGKYYGLFIEMKRGKGGQVSPVQRNWLMAANERGYLGIICNGFEMAKNIVDEYLNEKAKNG